MPDGLPILHTLLAEREMRLARQACEQSLYEFVRFMWTAVEPETPFVGSWVLRAICQHLEAITNGYEDQETGEHEKLTRLSINVYPGATKSLLVAVFWPAWEWGPQNKPHLRYLCFAYAAHLTERDNRRFRQLVLHPRYRALWGYRFTLSGESIGQIVNDKSGWKLASSVGGVGTGERGDRVILDDANKPPTDADPIGESNATLKSTGAWFREILPDRLNSIERSAIVNMQQRVDALDVSGIIMELGLPYEHLCIPMLLDTLPDRSGASRPIIETCLGWVDPRYRADWYEVEDDPDYEPWGPIVAEDELVARDGIIADARRFPPDALAAIRTAKGVYAFASQYQQLPSPRGGGIIQQEWWEIWEPLEFPEFGTCIASLDTAYKRHEEADYSALTVWCAFAHPETGKPKLMLRDAWQKRSSLADLVREIIKTCREHKVDTLVIENTARATDVADEIYKLAGRAGITIELLNPAGDKIARMHACVPVFENRIVYAPNMEWADMVIHQVTNFPRAGHDDLCFAAGTLIATKRGPIPIEHVRVGDLAFTPIGWREVTAAWQTGFDWVISRRGLIGTRNHPIFTVDRAFVRLDTISQASRLSRLTLCDLIQLALPRQWNLWASSIEGWADRGSTISPNRQRMQDAARPRGSTSPFGSMSTVERLRVATKCITSTVIRSISMLTTLIAYRWASIGGCRSGLIESATARYSRRSGRWLPLGMAVQKVALGIESMLRRVWLFAEVCLGTSKGVALATGAEPRMTSRASESVGALRNVSCNIPRGSAGKTASSIRTLQPVYNLTVKEANSYYANGILVHNCDSVSQALIYLRRTGVAVRREEHDDEIYERRRFRKQEAAIYDV